MHRKKLVIVTFVFKVVCLSPMLRAIYCSDFDIIFSSKMNVHCITQIIQQYPTFVIDRDFYVIGSVYDPM